MKFTVRFKDEKGTTPAVDPTVVYKDSGEIVLSYVTKHKELAAPLLKQFREHKPGPEEEWEFNHDDDLEKLAKEHEAAEKAKAEQEKAACLEAEVSVFGLAVFLLAVWLQQGLTGLEHLHSTHSTGGCRSWRATRCTTITLFQVMSTKESLRSAEIFVIWKASAVVLVTRHLSSTRQDRENSSLLTAGLCISA